LRTRIFYKLLLALLVTMTGLALLIVLVVNTSFRQGFADYLIERELGSVQGGVDRLATYYMQQGSWRRLYRNPRLWRQLLESDEIPFTGPRRRPPPPGGGFQPAANGFDRPPPGNRPPGPGHRPPRQGDDQSLHRRLVLVDARRERVFGNSDTDAVVRWVPITIDQHTAGWLGLIPQSLETDQLASKFVAQQRQNAGLIALAGLLVALLVAAVLARLFLRPVERVSRAANTLAEGDLAIRVPVQGRDELAQLSENFNLMARRLQQNEQSRRQWLADISHELRTPIAVLGGEIEALFDGIRKPSPDRIASLHSEVRALARLVEDLHQLALSDQGAMELRVAELDMEPLCVQMYELFQARMASGSLTLRLDINEPGDYRIRGDQRRLMQVLTNLLENSLRYTDAGGYCDLRLSRSAGQVVVEVSDSTPGVPPEAMQRIFERLYRVDKSRSRAQGGSGLGLSICRTIIEAHGGEIIASASERGGLKVTLNLPGAGQR